MKTYDSVLFPIVLSAAMAIPASAAVPPDATRIDVLLDFVEAFDESRVTNAMAASAKRDERSDGVALPGVFLHPQDANDAIAAYPDVAIPTLEANESCLLLFAIGFRDNIPWDGGKANGVRFIIRVDDKVVFEQDHAGVGWQPRAVDMAPWAGENVSVELRTNGIDANCNYDWCVFGEPILVRFAGSERYTELPANAAGVALAQIRCSQPATVTLSMGDAAQRVPLAEGTHLVPLRFSDIAQLDMEVSEGAAELVSVRAALHAPKLEFADMALSSPLVTVGTPFNIVLTVKNAGLGTYRGQDTLSLQTADAAALDGLGPAAGEAISLGVIAPNETRRYTWAGLVARQPGLYELSAPYPLRFRVFEPGPKTAPGHQSAASVTLTPDRRIRATVANAFSRLSFVVNGDGYAYAIAETWNGAAWQRAGTLYPLVSAVLRDGAGELRPLDFPVFDIQEMEQNQLRIRFLAKGPNDTNWFCFLTCTPAADAPRIELNAQLVAGAEADLVSFYGPMVLAGDRAYGASKDFAIFPGLEYLEGDEPSSSERDLAPPLNDRRVPARHKIASPIMAVQGQDSLIGLLWSAKPQQCCGHLDAAARFLAPKPGMGMEHVHMSLFAPPVGEYVRENTYGAYETPYRTKWGKPIHLDAWLVLDHAANYPKDSVVHGPYDGGLVLQAVRHWFDLYGFPEPSAPPRDWKEERALCRHAYAHAVWSEEPAGWRHCHGWEPGLTVSHAVPQMLDIRAGVSDEVRQDVERRINLVLDRASREHGTHYFWSGAGCHILMGELPFFYGYLPESMADFRSNAVRTLEGREDGLWVWRPSSERHAALGTPGDHTLGQAARNAYVVLRAARLTGDPELIDKALDAMNQMELYEVPRGAQTWECPLYQPDILAAAYAIRAYCEAYRITRDPVHIDHARYWAWTGLPFLYLWELDGYPTMRYNVIAVIGSTFFTHSWIGLPVVWCGEVYAYALLELAQFDDSLDWKRIATGINHSTMWQQYADGPSKGCYPDSWNMVKNSPNPADINPENILVNEFRLLGPSPEIRSARFDTDEGAVMLNSAADILEPRREAGGAIRFGLDSTPGFHAFSMLAPVPEPRAVENAGERVADSDALRAVDTGWLYDPGLRAVILKHLFTAQPVSCSVQW